MLCLYVHCVGCLWFYVTVGDSTWVPQQDNQVDESYTSKIWTMDVINKYMIFTYQSMCILTSNDWMPNTAATSAFAAMAILFGIIVTANLFGELAGLLYELHKNDIRY
jgi:hypothetical protein